MPTLQLKERKLHTQNSEKTRARYSVISFGLVNYRALVNSFRNYVTSHYGNQKPKRTNGNGTELFYRVRALLKLKLSSICMYTSWQSSCINPAASRLHLPVGHVYAISLPKIVLLSGGKSHGQQAHQKPVGAHRAGNIHLKKCPAGREKVARERANNFCPLYLATSTN